MKKENFPTGECAGKEPADKGVTTGVTDTYGTSRGDLAKGYSGGEKMSHKDTGSDK